MKPRYVITLIVAVLLAASAVLWYGQADGPTSVTRPEALVKQVLPTDLPAITEPGDPDVDAVELYEAVLDVYARHSDVPTRTPEHDNFVDQVGDLLIKAAAAGGVEPGFMDRHIPVAIGAQPDYQGAVEETAWAVLMHCSVFYANGEREKAAEMALALWQLGRRMFVDNTRLYTRNTGLDLMESAGGLLYQMSAENDDLDTEALSQWAKALDDIRQSWQPKLELMRGVDPHPGDLVNLALHDEDRMFRVEATLRLGIHRYGADRGNRRAMNRAIQKAIASDDPLLAEAGRAADAITHEQKRRFY